MPNEPSPYASLLRSELCARNVLYAAQEQLPHVTSYAVMKCVRSTDLKTKCKILTWQELSVALPLRLQRFLNLKYGITSSRAAPQAFES